MSNKALRAPWMSRTGMAILEIILIIELKLGENIDSPSHEHI